MKKVLATATAIMMGVACVGFAACDGNKGIKVNPDKENYVVGIVQLVAHDALDAATQGFMDALEDKLTEAGRTVEFDYQNAVNDISLCSTIVNNFKAKDVDLIMANATPALQAARAATSTIPIMGTSVTDYGVALGINDFNGTVGANVSGTSDLAPLDEQAEMMVDLLDLTSSDKVAILYCSSEPNSKYQADVVKAELAQMGITADVKTFVETNDISAVCNGIVAGGYDAVYVPTDNTVASHAPLIDSILRKAKIPVFAGEEGICSGCGFATLSISYYNIGVKVGEMAAEVLLGQKDIREMAIAYDQAPVKKYNATICADLGITVPNDYTVIAGTEVE
jgi:putative ABC transport system substrate-binding protein